MPDSSQRPLLLLSSRPWNIGLAQWLQLQLARRVHTIISPEALSREAVEKLDPEWIFVPHWSRLIPESIWGQWPTVIFHMTDLPYGRGGSPLQNLIQRGHSSTMITALCCGAGLDAGDVYIKQLLSLNGSAEEIFLRADGLIVQMIERIVHESPAATPQQGEPVLFSRRKPAQTNLANCRAGDLDACYNQIRMLDAEGYPHADARITSLNSSPPSPHKRRGLSGGIHRHIAIAKGQRS